MDKVKIGKDIICDHAYYLLSNVTVDIHDTEQAARAAAYMYGIVSLARELMDTISESEIGRE